MDKPSEITIKAMVLDKGVRFSNEFLNVFDLPYLAKRRAYGNSDSLSYINKLIPQEFYLLPSNIICAVNVRDSSDLIIDYMNDVFVLLLDNEIISEITFPHHPFFYDSMLSDNTPAKTIGTLYGGSALGLFVYGNCELVQSNLGCHYCSIKPNKSLGRDFVNSLTEKQVFETVTQATQLDGDTISQVMINGGIFKDHDRGFKHYVGLCKAAREALDKTKSNSELHLISYPPDNLNLIEELDSLNVSLAMNTEVHDDFLFSQYCPGKNKGHLKNALIHAVEILGKGKVYSIMVGGLEPLDTLRSGLHSLASSGVTPVINVFHPDPITKLEYYPAPTFEHILEMGAILQEVYMSHDYMKPFYDGCGRNSIDSEAFKGLFKKI